MRCEHAVASPPCEHVLTLGFTCHASVCFDVQEEVVVGGATSGTIKLWDLDQGKVIRTLVGHRSDCQAVEFHPYGAFFASGSLDTNLKVWDIRRKACIQTYKGHAAGLSVVRFSPDGKWVVSGDEDGLVKVWDLSAGKLLYEYAHDAGLPPKHDIPIKEPYIAPK
jgi:katanin p80 WD40 repeat-containing subunit B1